MTYYTLIKPLEQPSSVGTSSISLEVKNTQQLLRSSAEEEHFEKPTETALVLSPALGLYMLIFQEQLQFP